jgi:DNA polymerase III delta prime subunit
VEAARLNGLQDISESALPTGDIMTDGVQEQQDEGPSTPPLPDLGAVAFSSAPATDEPQKTTPKKQIRVTKSGRLVSSPPKPAFDVIPSPKKRRGRKPAKAKILPTVTVIPYGTDAASRSALGQKIEDILNSKKKLAARPAAQKKTISKPSGPAKSTHPFFLGKAPNDAPPAKVVATLPPATPRKSAVTPGKLRAETRRDRSPEDPPAFSRGLHASKVGKQAGLNEVSWPSGENAHVRNLDPQPPRLDNAISMQLPLRPRKLKQAVVTLPEHENLVKRLARDLGGCCRSKNRSTSDFEPPEDVRLPKRLLTTGAEIQRRVHEQLLVQLPRSDLSQEPLHPAVKDLFREIKHALTPFDEARCESQPWTLKYCPKSTSHVLQTSTDAVVLKDWLQSLTVMAVSGASKVTTTLDVKQPPRKKRKKALDDFIVPDDEEDDDEDMVMLPPAEGASSTQSMSFRQPQWTRNKNVVLISGPHGCGKSAMVHAVAKEMGFEVFEIHAGMRRSGKDIQDKVGDMTANHLVNHKRNTPSVQEPAQAVDDTDDVRIDTTVEDDINSGRQGTMTSFFQVKPGTGVAKPKVKAKVPEVSKISTPVAQATLPMAQASRNSQKQSLILIEEADILFEEDQQFWAQIIKIASLSKRPIIITCNDERQIPIQDLPLAAVLRLQPPPVELATDYLLVLAGREGHILERQTVREMYESKNHDLRASIMELDFWCQMSVGDRKGGLEWMYQRWPPGKDLDEHGQTLRVASEGTYTSGMGWLSHNVFETQGNSAFDVEEELLQEVWTDWGISPSAWGVTGASGTQSSGTPNTDRPNQLRELARLDNYADSLSAADVFCRVDLPTYEPSSDQPTDSSQPPITDKARLSYTLAAPVLQVDHSADFLNLDTAFSTQTHLLIQRTFPDLSQRHSLSTAPHLRTETDYARAILQHRRNRNRDNTLTRLDFAAALDPLAAPPDQLLPERTSFTLTPSSFDRTFNIITLDLAPYVRSIVAHEQILEEQRVRMSSLLTTAGGIGGKRGRTTRASRVALEGGVRETKRKDRWFDADVDFDAVMRTAGREWTGLGWRGENWNEDDGEEGTASLAGTQEGAEDGDVAMQGAQE